MKPRVAVAIAWLAACQSATDPLASDQEAIGVTLSRAPDAIDCIAFTLMNADGTSQTYAYAIARSIRIPNVTVGAYQLSAVAYNSGLAAPATDAQCAAALPASAPWTTEAAVPVTVARNDNTQVSITLIRAGTITVKAGFFEAPEVVASAQGNPAFIAAVTVGNDTFVAWANNQPNAGSQILRIIDDVGPPLVLAGGLVNIGMVAVDPISETVYWEDGLSGATDADGHFIIDGSLHSAPGGPPATGLFPADLAVAGDHRLYWGELTTNSIDCLGCAAPLAENEISPFTLAAHGSRVYWDTVATGVINIRGMDVTDAAPQTLATITPFQAYGMAADDSFVYWIDFDPAAGVDHSRIVALPALGGMPTVLVPDTLNAFPLIAYKGNVFYSDARGVHSVSSSGGAPVDVVTTPISGFSVTTDAAGHDVVYWTDPTHGGLVWRGRLN